MEMSQVDQECPGPLPFFAEPLFLGHWHPFGFMYHQLGSQFRADYQKKSVETGTFPSEDKEKTKKKT